ncbi:hypothetical protein [Xanthobacter autotrophicus]|uniref:hypothetical protein n=1 Tax=Xanthobacter autotrophicus TaxID=280 RepID=UPI00372A3118
MDTTTTERTSVTDLRKQLQAALTEKAGLEASRLRWKADAEKWKAEAERWKAEAMGKITDEWRTIHEAGAKPIEG